MANWRPFVFSMNMNYGYDQLDTKEILCVKFHNSGIISFGGDADTTVELINRMSSAVAKCSSGIERSLHVFEARVRFKISYSKCFPNKNGYSENWDTLLDEKAVPTKKYSYNCIQLP